MSEGRFKSWLNKPRLSSEDWRKKVEFVIKQIGWVLGGVVFVLFGSQYIDSRAKRLGETNIPNADTSMSDYFESFSPVDNSCAMSGQYIIKNQGELAFKITHVDFQLVRVRQVSLQPGEKVRSLSLNTLLTLAEPVFNETIDVGEIASKDNEIQVNFSYLIDKNKDEKGYYYYYAVVAQGFGGVAQEPTWVDSIFVTLGLADSSLWKFEENSLRHVGSLEWICDGVAN